MTRKITGALMLVTVAIWIVWDIWAYVEPTAGDTESEVIGDVGARFAFLPIAFGTLTGHFFWRVRDESPTHWKWLVGAGIVVLVFSLAQSICGWILPSWAVMGCVVAGVFLGRFTWPQRAT